jgi:hypothetical protein
MQQRQGWTSVRAMRPIRSALFCLVVAAIVLPVVQAAPAFADAVTALGLAGFGSMVVDGPRSHVILSEGAGGSRVVFADFDGNILDTITGLSGPSGMVRVGTVLYVVERDSGQITPIDLTTDAVGTATATSSDPWNMIGYANGRLWADGADGLDRINPTTGSVADLTGTDFARDGASDFATDPTDPTELAVLTSDGGWPTIRIYDVSTMPPTLVRSKAVTSTGDVRYSPDGSQLYLPGHSGVDEYATSDLSLTHSYDFGYVNGGYDSFDVGGQRFLGGGSPSFTRIRVYPEQVDTPILDEAVTNDGYSRTVMPRGARFSPSGDRLFAVVNGGGLALVVFDDPTLPASTTTLTAPAQVIFGDPIHLTGSLSYDDSSPVEAGEPIEIWQATDNQPAVMVGSTTTAIGGAWSFDQPTDMSEINTTLSFRAVFSGNDSHRTSRSGLRKTDVWKLQPKLRLRASDTSIRVGDHVRLHVHLALDGAVSREVSIRASDGIGSTRVASITVDRDGDGAVALKPLHNVEYWANSTGDPTHDAVQSNHERVKVHARVSGRLGGYYAIKNRVRLYHRGDNPVYGIHVEPNSRGSDVFVTLQKHTSNGWKTVVDRYFQLRRGSSVVLLISGTKLTRSLTYRIDASFENSRTAYGVSPWASFRIA